MAIKQTIEYNSNNTYFSGFLQALINESEINGNVSQHNKEIVLLLDESDSDVLERFVENTGKYLPHSIFLGEIQSTQEDAVVKPSRLKSGAYNISLCPKCLQKITDPASENYLDDTIECHHYSNKEVSNFQDLNNYSPHYSKDAHLLVVDSATLHELFIVTEDETKALFSIEKPTIKVTIKDETLKQLTGKKFINIKSPFSIRSVLTALNAKEAEVPYLFFEPEHDLKVSVTQKNITLVKDDMGIEGELKVFHTNDGLNRFLNISKEAGFIGSALGAYLSIENGIKFCYYNRSECKYVLEFQEFKLGEVVSQMSRDEKKQKLLVNFEKKYPHIIDEFSQNPEYSLFEAVASVLEIHAKSFESVSDKSLEFHGNGGLKIDTNFTDTGFDYVSFLGSIMSFKLADTDDHYLAYSIFEALGDMSISTLNQLKTKYKVTNFVMMGNMFENSVLHSRILSKFQLAKPYFPKGFALDD